MVRSPIFCAIDLHRRGRLQGRCPPSEQEPIVDRDLFEAVQAKQANDHKRTRIRSEVLLAGRISDDAGNRMSPAMSENVASNIAISGLPEKSEEPPLPNGANRILPYG